ncbi:MAG: glycosyltransferase, partial [Anaerolineae bacterium]|nr:glycosyltransferase [Thermoflexales bacterium]MDW8406552.1 glycosyltransferase [Anaerolineae bacterium]
FSSYAKQERIPAPAKAILPALNAALRAWERRAAQRVDQFIAISRAVQHRIRTYYGRDSIIIYPPVQINRFAVSTTHADYFLIVSRLLPYKRIDLAVEACNRLRLPLVIAGDGRDRPRLERLAGPSVRFLGRVDEATLHQLLAGCRAFLFPGLEDFGIAPIQAMACGKPVIAYAGGGALDTVIDGVTGLLFDEPNAEALAAALSKLETVSFSPTIIRAHAEQFSTERFQREIMHLLREHASPRLK